MDTVLDPSDEKLLEEEFNAVQDKKRKKQHATVRTYYIYQSLTQGCIFYNLGNFLSLAKIKNFSLFLIMENIYPCALTSIKKLI